ncbi:hypothetical protein IPG41_01785 [Candidatus Peregrinibacteria bacterium]|nr:MAG: hypothetical protein IPG41_01785 [Candidatus Peregrinibacteria bacterium]
MHGFRIQDLCKRDAGRKGSTTKNEKKLFDFLILFKKYGPTEVEMDGQEMLLLEEEDILAIIE